MKEFILMNKDIKVIYFKVDRTSLGINIIAQSEVLSPLPLGMSDMRTWLESRYVLQYRVPTKNFFRPLGITCLEDFISITHCTSLQDSYWVKEKGSRISWKSVSLYRNSLNSSIANYSFSGRIQGKVTESGSPDFSTDGNFPKCWVRKNGELFLYKAGSSGARNAGNEPYSEIYAYKIAQKLGFNNVPYTLGKHKGILVSRCKCICNEDYGLLQYDRYSGEYDANFPKLLDTERNIAIVNMLLLDYVTCNVDRHYGNFGYIIHNGTQKAISFAPIYDNNLSCIPYYMEDEDLEFYINDIVAKDGSKFIDLYKMIDCDYTRSKLKSLVGFDASIGCKRDKIVNRMVRYQVERVLKGI